MGSYLQGIFKPTKPQKYKGDVKNIIYRSSWELSFLSRLDLDDNVLQYSSEEVIIPYRHPISNTIRRYFVDFWVRYKDGRTLLIEIKPHKETLPPTPSSGKRKKSKKTLLNEHLTYAVNMAKWEAADKYCKKKGWEFHVFTELELGI